MTFSQRRNVVTFSNFVNGVYDVFTEYVIANFYRKMFYQIASYICYLLKFYSSNIYLFIYLFIY